MTYQFLELDASHNESLLQLSKSTNTGSDLFYVDRSPSFFSLSDEFGETRQFGLFKGNELIGSVAVSKQKRCINGICDYVYYLNDLRIHPEYQKTLAFYRLTEKLLSLYVKEGKVKWMFSTVLDSNENRSSIIKGSNLIPGGRQIGRTVHIGVPLFIKQKKRSCEVFEITGEEAWGVYKGLAGKRGFAPCDKAIFLRENGQFFVIRNQRNESVALCKLVDQSKSRKLRMSKELRISFKILNLLCLGTGCPPLPGKGEVFHHGYVSYFVTRDSSYDYMEEFVSYFYEHFRMKFSYLFFGVSEGEAATRRKKLFQISLTSTTFGYGEMPLHVSMDFHELTLV